MAGVPTYDDFKVNPQGQTGFSIAVPDQRGFEQPIGALAETSRATSAMGEELGRIVRIEADRANKTVAQAALNDAREIGLRLTYDQKDGYTNVKGRNVLPKDGKPLADDYGEKFNTELARVRAGLANDAQRELFDSQAGALQAGFTENVMRYERSEWNVYQKSVVEGDRLLTIEEIARNRSDPEKVEASLIKLDNTVAQGGALDGLSAQQIEAVQLANRSAAIGGAVEAALNENDLPGAQALFAKFRGQMNEADEGKADRILRREAGDKAAMDIAELVVNGGAMPGSDTPTGTPKTSAISQRTNYVAPVEYRGPPSSGFGAPRGSKVHNGVDIPIPEGSPVKAPLGGTVIQAWNDTKNGGGNSVRIRMDDGTVHGFAHLSGFNVKNGDRVEAGQVFAKSGNTGKSTGPHLHWTVTNKDGQKVNPLSAKPGEQSRQAGQPARVNAASTLGEAMDRAVALYREDHPGASAEEIRTVRSEVAQRWSVKERDKADREEAGLVAALKHIENGGTVANMPASLKAGIPPGKLGAVMNYQEGLRASQYEGEGDVLYYGQLLQNPQFLYDMPESQFNMLLPRLGKTMWTNLANERGNYKLARQGKPVADKVGTLPRESVNRITNGRLETLGLDPSPKEGDADAPRVFAIRATIDRSVLAEQARLGRALTDAELINHIDQLFLTTIPTETRTWTGKVQSKGTGNLFNYGASDIPSGTRRMIVSQLAARGVKNPTEAQILEEWYASKTFRRGRK